jgi:hypothetical protein
MSKGFSGINDISNRSERVPETQSNSVIEVKGEQEQKEKDNFVSFSNAKSMPGLWQSQDKGIAWESEDYIFVFQYKPCKESLVMDHIAKGGKPIGSLAAPSSADLRYLWVLCVYYKPGKGPKQKNDSLRWPVLIVTLEQANLLLFAKLIGKSLAQLDCDASGWDSPNLCMFTPGGGHLNMGTIKDKWGIKAYSLDSLSSEARKQLETKVIDYFLKTACEHLGLSEQPTRIGNMYNGFCAVYSDKMPPEVKEKILNQSTSSGCLGMFLLLPFLGIAALVKAVLN